MRFKRPETAEGAIGKPRSGWYDGGQFTITTCEVSTDAGLLFRLAPQTEGSGAGLWRWTTAGDPSINWGYGLLRPAKSRDIASRPSLKGVTIQAGAGITPYGVGVLLGMAQHFRAEGVQVVGGAAGIAQTFLGTSYTTVIKDCFLYHQYDASLDLDYGICRVEGGQFWPTGGRYAIRTRGSGTIIRDVFCPDTPGLTAVVGLLDSPGALVDGLVADSEVFPPRNLIRVVAGSDDHAGEASVRVVNTRPEKLGDTPLLLDERVPGQVKAPLVAQFDELLGAGQPATSPGIVRIAPRPAKVATAGWQVRPPQDWDLISALPAVVPTPAPTISNP